MRGSDALQECRFTLAKLDDFVPADHGYGGKIGVTTGDVF